MRPRTAFPPLSPKPADTINHPAHTSLEQERIAELEQWLAEAKGDVARLEGAALAYRDLSLCYRVRKQPSEKLFNRLEKANAALEAIDAARKGRG